MRYTLYPHTIHLQRWCNIPCLIRCNNFASTAFSSVCFKMFLERVVRWRVSSGGVLSVLNTKCFILYIPSYEILYSTHSDRSNTRRESVVFVYHVETSIYIRNVDEIVIIIYTWNLLLADWWCVFQGRFSFFNPLE